MCRNDMRQGCVCPPSYPVLASESINTLKCTFCFYPNRINRSGIQYIRHHTSYHEKANKLMCWRGCSNIIIIIIIRWFNLNDHFWHILSCWSWGEVKFHLMCLWICILLWNHIQLRKYMIWVRHPVFQVVDTDTHRSILTFMFILVWKSQRRHCVKNAHSVMGAFDQNQSQHLNEFLLVWNRLWMPSRLDGDSCGASWPLSNHSLSRFRRCRQGFVYQTGQNLWEGK